MCPSAPRVCSEPGGQKPVLSLSLDLIQENAIENVVWKMAAMLSRPQCDNGLDSNRCQAITRNNIDVDPNIWRQMVSLGHNYFSACIGRKDKEEDIASKRTHDAIITALLHRNDVATSFRHKNDVISASRAPWMVLFGCLVWQFVLSNVIFLLTFTIIIFFHILCQMKSTNYANIVFSVIAIISEKYQQRRINWMLIARMTHFCIYHRK